MSEFFSFFIMIHKIKIVIILISAIIITFIIMIFPYVDPMVNHAGISVVILNPEQLHSLTNEHENEIPNLNDKDLQEFPELLKMFNIILQSQEEGLIDTKTIFVDFQTYRIYYNDNDQEYRIKNYMSDSKSEKLILKIKEYFGTNILNYKNSNFLISDWIS